MKVAIIGAGASGLTAIKCCLDEGIKPTCFEMQDSIGGLWNFDPGEKNGATVYRSTVINTSKEMMCYSDFPIPKEFPNYMHNTKVQEYFELYAEKFDLKKHIHFHTEVMSCIPADGFASNGQWKVTTRNVKSQEAKSDYFDGVLVCVGHHAVPYYPLSSFPGIENFKGKYTHSHTYRDHRGYEDIRVAIVGIGNSGGDIAVELSRHSKQIFLSTRRGSWILKRIHENGMPLDYTMSRKVLKSIQNLLPHSFVDFMARAQIESRLDHAKYSLLPKHGVFSQHPMVNDDIANRIITGGIKVKGNIVRFTEHGAVFEDGTEEELDAVIFATGYSVKYPFLADDILKVDENDADLYKYMYPTSLSKNTLAVIGCIQPLGAINPISEMQCRLATRVIKGQIRLPSNQEMKRDISEKRFAMQRRYVKSRRHTVQVDYIEYMDELADLTSCKPDILQWFLKDPQLAAKVYFGPAVPYIYRLQGPGVWPGARKAIMTVDERVLYPLATRKVSSVQGRSVKSVLLLALIAVIVGWLFGMF